MNIIEVFNGGARIVEYPKRPECERYEAQYYKQYKVEGEHKEGWRTEVCGNLLQCYMWITKRVRVSV